MFNTSLTNNRFSSQLLYWFDQHGRHDLPWQHPRSPYRVWLAEIMLQQTQVQTVIAYFNRFITRFPEITDLAAASPDDVMRQWAGLGYYARARNLHQTAQIICQHYAGQFPQDAAALEQLPGIGRSTAAAILAQAFDLRHCILDGNVKRVLARYHGVQGWPGERKVQDLLWRYAEHHTPQQRIVDYTQGIMDMGATVCTRSKPRCHTCPVSADCYAYVNNCATTLPARKPTKVLPTRATRMLVMRDTSGRVLLEKRPPSGIWGSLWSLPELQLDVDVQEECRHRWGFSIAALNDGMTFRHTFSHYHLDITPCYITIKNPGFCVMEQDRWLWYNNALSERPGLPAPVTAILNQMPENN